MHLVSEYRISEYEKLPIIIKIVCPFNKKNVFRSLNLSNLFKQSFMFFQTKPQI